MNEQRKYWIGFHRVSGIGAARFRLLLDAFGDLETAWHASATALARAGLDAKCLQALLGARQAMDLEAEEARLGACGAAVLTWEDEDYPRRLREISTPPPVLYAVGELMPQDQWSVAVVGTRRPSAYGRSVAEDLARVLASAGVTVVSGLARGIDGFAHRAALDARGRTLAVLGSGVDRIYPPEHRRMAGAIAGQGAVLSDYPLGTPPEAGNFPPRNRLIAGLSLVVVVVEAGESSGALITAEFGAEQGREVFAVPGSIYSRPSRGAHQLIRAGARPLVSMEEVVEALNMDVVARQESLLEPLPEDPSEAVILASLSSQPVHIDDLRLRCGLTPAALGATLAFLELRGRVQQVGGMHYVRVRERPAAYRIE